MTIEGKRRNRSGGEKAKCVGGIEKEKKEEKWRLKQREGTEKRRK